MATIGNLLVNLGAETADFHKSMNQATRKMQSTQAQTNKHLSRMERGFTKFKKIAKSSLGVLAGGALVGAAARGLQQTAANISQLVNKAQGLDSTVAELTALQHAASLTNADTKALTDSATELQIRLGEFVTEGGGPAAEMLEKLDLNAQKLIKQPLPEQMATIADEVAKMESASEQAAVASAFLSDEGVEKLLPMLQQGGEAFRNATSEVDRFGTALTTKGAQAVEDMVDDGRRLGEAWSGLWRQITVRAAPALEWLAEKATWLLTKFTQAFTRIDDVWHSLLASIAKGANHIVFAVKASWVKIQSSFGNAIDEMKKRYADFLDFVAQGQEKIPGVGEGMAANTRNFASKMRLDATRSQQNRGDETAARMQELREERERSINAIDNVTRAQLDLNQSTKAGDTNLEALTKSQKQANEARAKAVEHSDAMARAFDMIEGQFEDLEKAEARQIAGLQEMDSQTREVSTTMDEAWAKAIRQFEDLENKGTSMGDTLKNAVSGWASDFSRSLNDLLWQADTTFDEILKSFGRMITRMVIQKQVVQPVMQSFGMTSNAKGNVFQGGEVQAFAQGGVISQPTVFPMKDGAGVMGEAGPEAVMPLQRTSGGELGVKAESGGQMPPIEVNIYGGSGDAEVEQGQNDQGGPSLDVFLDGAMAEKAADPGSKFRRSLDSSTNVKSASAVN